MWLPTSSSSHPPPTDTSHPISPVSPSYDQCRCSTHPLIWRVSWRYAPTPNNPGCCCLSLVFKDMLLPFAEQTQELGRHEGQVQSSKTLLSCIYFNLHFCWQTNYGLFASYITRFLITEELLGQSLHSHALKCDNDAQWIMTGSCLNLWSSERLSSFSVQKIFSIISWKTVFLHSSPVLQQGLYAALDDLSICRATGNCEHLCPVQRWCGLGPRRAGYSSSDTQRSLLSLVLLKAQSVL